MDIAINKNSLVILIHSFSDLITNSSSETFISVNGHAIKTVKELVNLLLSCDKKEGESKLTFDDLFEADIVFPVDTSCIPDNLKKKWKVKKDDWESKLTEGQVEELSKYHETDEAEAMINNGDIESFYDPRKGNGESFPQSEIRVTVKEGNDCKDAKKIAAILSNLEGLFEINSGYC